MTNQMVKIFNADTGKEVERDMNADELKQWQTDQDDLAAKNDQIAKDEKAKAELLVKLGITANEARLLIG